MTKDGLREKITRDLHRVYDDVLRERLPDAWRELIESLR